MIRPMLARSLMVTRLVTLSPGMELFDAIGVLLRHRISGASVVDVSGRYVGTFNEKSCMQALLDAAGDTLSCTTIDGFIKDDMPTIDEETDLLTVAHLFNTSETRRLPVLRDGQLIGQISRRDVLNAAHDMFNIAPDRESGLLNLSGILDRPAAPVG